MKATLGSLMSGAEYFMTDGLCRIRASGLWEPWEREVLRSGAGAFIGWIVSLVTTGIQVAWFSPAPVSPLILPVTGKTHSNLDGYEQQPVAKKS